MNILNKYLYDTLTCYSRWKRYCLAELCVLLFPEKALEAGMCHPFLCFLFLIISIYCMIYLTVTVRDNKLTTLPLSQNKCWNPREQSISRWIRVSSSSLKRVLSWQITHSDLSVVNPRMSLATNTAKESLSVTSWTWATHTHCLGGDFLWLQTSFFLPHGSGGHFDRTYGSDRLSPTFCELWEIATISNLSDRLWYDLELN